MKTQLLQDLDESGSTNGPPPPVRTARRPAPHVWRRPATARTAAPMPPPAPPPVFAEEAAIPAWLDERMRADAQSEENAAWSSLWKRRAVTWSVGLSLLAAVAAGGLWLYEDNRVDGALVVVARTTPEAPAPVPVAAPPVAPILPLVLEPDPVPVPTSAPVVVQEEVEPPPPAAPALPKTSVRRATPPRRVASAEPTSRQRREETLMQCRAHGLDQRRCDLQGCSMTRYGFACRGN